MMVKIKKRVMLNQTNFRGLHIAPGICGDLKLDFSSGAICMVMASHTYDESDYIRDYDLFLKEKK